MSRETNANFRYVYGPYSKFPYPYEVGYPAYTFPGKQPYIFRHYIAPTYYEMWDYNKQDQKSAEYNESLRAEITNEIANKKVRK
jgi:hypothetical protein